MTLYHVLPHHTISGPGGDLLSALVLPSDKGQQLRVLDPPSWIRPWPAQILARWSLSIERRRPGQLVNDCDDGEGREGGGRDVYDVVRQYLRTLFDRDRKKWLAESSELYHRKNRRLIDIWIESDTFYFQTTSE